MCRPIQGNSVRIKVNLEVKPLAGSSDIFLTQKSVTLLRGWNAIAEGPAKRRDVPKGKDPDDHYILLVEHGDNDVVRACLHHTEIKGVELTA